MNAERTFFWVAGFGPHGARDGESRVAQVIGQIKREAAGRNVKIMDLAQPQKASGSSRDPVAEMLAKSLVIPNDQVKNHHIAGIENSMPGLNRNAFFGFLLFLFQKYRSDWQPERKTVGEVSVMVFSIGAIQHLAGFVGKEEGEILPGEAIKLDMSLDTDSKIWANVVFGDFRLEMQPINPDVDDFSTQFAHVNSPALAVSA